ncbi:MAG TPA: bifunctional helix-turn-helix transcriptional regulator/GNAT family N-acetyltransferase [Chitinophaga sp.]|uniref:bifunctional helix-turn-helix transcriptional regulator/GNAT family N-acetyltransferase n=1 Tax=Chitinophaga sp. TaxID=1869181 RepID=UPI002C94D2E7|nr:bifunctional helix-turn-helix transcriptional regulator/GNAT family N-acetyltransferase [Chitinophaga sp.]HVI47721.1 bifunctional helix-turn-helix transcriptional regulator/GNAT family N-acetyltransferase [Chitinophaga sp.]
MEFYQQAGVMAIGSRLRRLNERMTDQAKQICSLYHTDFHPKWFPVFYMLGQEGNKCVTDIAKEIGHSHASVSKTLKEMEKAGYVTVQQEEGDGRKSQFVLSEKGKVANRTMQEQCEDVTAIIKNMLDESSYNLWKAIEEWEFMLDQKELVSRVVEEKKAREGRLVEIVDYQPKYHHDFRNLNVEWITRLFTMEASDYKALDHPKEHILSKGGYILMALYDGEPVGTCALIKMDDHSYELAKMAVTERVRGKGIGYLLGKAIIDKAKGLGAKRLYLGSNTVLKPAISLYHKLGFKKIKGEPSPYARANVHMELWLK